MIYQGQKIAGVDEVGRGCLFGPVFAGAVVLNETAGKTLQDLGLTDSKAMSKKHRAFLVPKIEKLSTAWGLGQASAREIDTFGIRLATEKAMIRALQKISGSIDLVLVDGILPIRNWEGPQKTLVNGDSSNIAISAASVLAKQSRDELIKRLSNQFPKYGLEKHVGYGTALHRSSLLTLGATSLHRKTFLKKLYNQKKLSKVIS